MKRLIINADVGKVLEGMKKRTPEATINSAAAAVSLSAANIIGSDHNLELSPLSMVNEDVGEFGEMYITGGHLQPKPATEPAPTVVEFCRTQFTINWDNGAMGAVIYFDEDMPRVKYFNEEPLRPTDDNPTYRMPEDDLSFPEEQCMLVYRP